MRPLSKSHPFNYSSFFLPQWIGSDNYRLTWSFISFEKWMRFFSCCCWCAVFAIVEQLPSSLLLLLLLHREIESAEVAGSKPVVDSSEATNTFGSGVLCAAVIEVEQQQPCNAVKVAFVNVATMHKAAWAEMTATKTHSKLKPSRVRSHTILFGGVIYYYCLQCPMRSQQAAMLD